MMKKSILAFLLLTSFCSGAGCTAGDYRQPF